MKPGVKILVGIIVILLVVCVALGVLYSRSEESIGEKERMMNVQRQSNIDTYNIEIESLSGKVTTLEDEINVLRNEEPAIRYKTIHIIDSVEHLSFGGKGLFFAGEITYLDSVRQRYVGSDNL